MDKTREGPEICYLLQEDLDLAELIPPHQRAAATDQCIAPVMHVAQDNWDGGGTKPCSAGIGVLVLNGLLIRRVGIRGHFGAELLGHGDVLRPWQEAPQPGRVCVTDWRLLEPLRVAVLDKQATQRLSNYPELTAGLIERALARSHNLATNMAIISQARVDVRLHLLLWDLAQRWGQAQDDEIILPLPLTHAALAELVAARRPTVSTAISSLTQRGIIRSVGRSWLISAPPPDGPEPNPHAENAGGS